MPLLLGWKSFYIVKFRNAAFGLNQAEALGFAVIALTWYVPRTDQSHSSEWRLGAEQGGPVIKS